MMNIKIIEQNVMKIVRVSEIFLVIHECISFDFYSLHLDAHVEHLSGFSYKSSNVKLHVESKGHKFESCLNKDRFSYSLKIYGILFHSRQEMTFLVKWSYLCLVYQ